MEMFTLLSIYEILVGDDTSQNAILYSAQWLYLAISGLTLLSRRRGRCPHAPVKPTIGQFRWSEIARVRQFYNKGKYDHAKIKTSSTNDH